jgi:hypothetical protein
MAKPSDFYVSALDFFGTILPGAVTVGAGVVFDVPAHLPSGVRQAFAFDVSKIGAFIVVAYVVGQVSNSVGSLLLDLAYDAMYDPKHGWFSKPALKEGIEASWLERTFGIYDRGTEDRRKRLREELQPLVVGPVKGEGPTKGAIKGVYQTVRAYLKIASPETFADLEKLEGEQKFFRALTVGVLALALCLLPGGTDSHGKSAYSLSLSALFFVRYVSIRRKTVERAYVYFSVRGSFHPSTKSGAEQNHDA